jgi:Spy/CpxP family protein refolding chaperone
MRKMKHLLVAAVVAMSTLTVGATPQTAAAKAPSTAEAAAQQLAEGWYSITDLQSGQTVGWFHVNSQGQVDQMVPNPNYRLASGVEAQ